MKMLILLLALASVSCVSMDDTAQMATTPRPGALVIAYSADSADTFVANRVDSVVALDWLREITATHQIALETRSYPYGTLIERIGHRHNGDGGYWLYKVNGQMVPKSSGDHRVAWSDTLTFFFDER